MDSGRLESAMNPLLVTLNGFLLPHPNNKTAKDEHKFMRNHFILYIMCYLDQQMHQMVYGG